MLLNVLLSYMILNYSNSHHHSMKIVQFVSYEYLHFKRGINTILVVEKLYAVDVFMLLSMIIKAIKLLKINVHFVEHLILNQKKR